MPGPLTLDEAVAQVAAVTPLTEQDVRDLLDLAADPGAADELELLVQSYRDSGKMESRSSWDAVFDALKLAGSVAGAVGAIVGVVSGVYGLTKAAGD